MDSFDEAGDEKTITSWRPDDVTHWRTQSYDVNDEMSNKLACLPINPVKMVQESKYDNLRNNWKGATNNELVTNPIEDNIVSRFILLSVPRLNNNEHQ